MVDFAAVERAIDLTAERVIKSAREEWNADLAKVVERLEGKISDLRSDLTIAGHLRQNIVPTSARAPCVLVADDYPAFLKVISDALEEAGMVVHRAPTTDDALLILAQVPELEVGLVDVSMPKNGYMLLDYVHEYHPGITMIMTSGRDLEPERALNLGAFDFLPKPYDVRMTMLKIQRAAEFHRMKLAAKLPSR